jgi:hypothetical protein
MSKSHIFHVVTKKSDFDFGGAGTANPIARGALRPRVRDFFNRLVTGKLNDVELVEVVHDEMEAKHAGQIVVVATASGTCDITLNGVEAASITADGTDAEDALELATAINANTAMAGLVVASCKVAAIACTSVGVGNKITVMGITLTAAAATSSSDPTIFAQITSDTATASSLATIICNHPYLGKFLWAENVTGTVHIGLRPYAEIANKLIVSLASTMVVTNGSFANTTKIFLWCPVPGVIGNCCSVAVSGTGMSVLASASAYTLGAGASSQSANDYLAFQGF